jgi:hypothetical protein
VLWEGYGVCQGRWGTGEQSGLACLMCSRLAWRHGCTPWPAQRAIGRQPVDADRTLAMLCVKSELARSSSTYSPPDMTQLLSVSASV